MKVLRHARGTTPLDRCLVMGIVNRTPDSFYDPGRMRLDEVVSFGLGLVDDGADLLDVGGVKAGPGEEVSEDEEARRVVPLVAALAACTEVPISVDTGRASVARRALEAGAAIVNDVTGLADPELAPVVAESGAAFVVVHHGGQIRARPRHPRFDDVVADVLATWARLVELATKAGVRRESIVVDAALDFGKTTFHSLELVHRLPEQLAAGFPIMVAASRKDLVGETLGAAPADRLEGSLAVAAVAAYLGAHIVRVHDVRESVRTVRMAEAIAARRPPAAALRGLWE
ncbi:MAG TPA: dihydropteroate synthase [Actinomycetota bacterium]|nr:dihydropteroate synthase [Actinomycetota bacterium]